MDLDKLKPAVREAMERLHEVFAALPRDAVAIADLRCVETLRAELMRLAGVEAELAAIKQKVDGYAVTLADKSHPSGLRYVMAYNDRETADVLLRSDRNNKGLGVRAFRLLDEAGEEQA